MSNKPSQQHFCTCGQFTHCNWDSCPHNSQVSTAITIPIISQPSQQQPAEETSKLRAPTTISPAEEELETLANDYAEYHYSEPELKHFYSIAYAAYMACGRKLRKRYTRQGGEDWEALYISEHLNLLAAKGRIAELEKQLREFDNSLKEANKNRG